MPKQSKYWTYFERLTDQESKCVVCSKKVKAPNNTTNLMTHLKNHHKSLFQELSCNKSDSDPGQPRITSQFIELDSIKGGDKKKLIDNKICWWIVMNSLPYNICETPFFSEFTRALNSNYSPPKRHRVKSLIDGLYQIKKDQVILFLKNVKWFSLTSDGWKDVSNQIYYVGLTLHFVDEYKIYSVCIKTMQLSGESTATNLEKFFLESLIENDISKDQIVAFTTDGASNYTKAAEAISTQIHCVAHRINLIVNDSLSEPEDLKNLIASVKTIVTLFKRSDILMKELIEEREKHELPGLKLIQDVATRWNSTFYMLKRYLLLHNEISYVLLTNAKRALDLSDESISCLEEIVLVLQPFEEITTDISGERYITVSRIIPLIASIRVLLAKIHPKNRLAADLVRRLQRSLDKRFAGIERNKLFGYSTVLDPRFKTILFSSTSDCSHIVTLLNSELTEVELTQRPPIEIDPDEPMIWKIHSNKVRSLSNPANGMNSGLKHYLEADVMPRSSDPLIFWKENKSNWPQLHNLAMKYLIIQATSVPCERLFSKTGSIITVKRNRIKPKNVVKLCYLSSLPSDFI